MNGADTPINAWFTAAKARVVGVAEPKSKELKWVVGQRIFALIVSHYKKLVLSRVEGPEVSIFN